MSGLLGTSANLSIDGNSVGDITNINIGGISIEAINVTTMDSTAMEYLPSLLQEAGEVTFDINIDGAVPSLGTAVVPIAITYGTSGSFACNGFVTNVSAVIPLEDVITCSVTIKLTGTVTWS